MKEVGIGRRDMGKGGHWKEGHGKRVSIGRRDMGKGGHWKEGHGKKVGMGRRDMGKEVHGGKMDHGEGWGGCGDTFSYKYSLIARKSL